MPYATSGESCGLDMSIDTVYGRIQIKVAGSEEQEIDSNIINLLRITLNRLDIDCESLSYN